MRERNSAACSRCNCPSAPDLPAGCASSPYVMYLVRSPRDRSATWSAGPLRPPRRPLREVRERVPRGARDGRDHPDRTIGAGHQRADARLVRLGAPEGWGLGPLGDRADVRRRDEGPAAATGPFAGAARKAVTSRVARTPAVAEGVLGGFRGVRDALGAQARRAMAGCRGSAAAAFDIVGFRPPQLSKPIQSAAFLGEILRTGERKSDQEKWHTPRSVPSRRVPAMSWPISRLCWARAGGRPFGRRVEELLTRDTEVLARC